MLTLTNKEEERALLMTAQAISEKDGDTFKDEVLATLLILIKHVAKLEVELEKLKAN